MKEPEGNYAAPMTRLSTLHTELGWCLRDSRTQPAKIARAKRSLKEMQRCMDELHVHLYGPNRPWWRFW